MRIKTFASLITVAVIVLLSCSRSVVSLDYTNAKGEVPQLGNLTFRFSKSLIADSLLNVWDSAEYISFEPKIPGRFRWESPDQLVFSPLQPLKPATNYKAKIGSEVLRYSKFNSVQDGDKINFHTPDLALDNAQAIWMLQDESSKTAVPQVDLYFNYAIHPAELKEKLSVLIGGNKADYTVLTASADNKISLRIVGLKNEDKDYETKIIIGKGLKPESGTNGTEDDIKSALTIPSPYVLNIQNVEADHDGVDGTVKVTTSQQLSGDNINSLIKLSPEVKFTVEQNNDGFTIRSDKFDVEKSYSLTIVKGLRGRIGGVLNEDYNGSIAFGKLEASVRFTNSKAVYLSKRGNKNIEVQLTSVPKVKLVISKVYENNLLLANRYGYEPKDNNADYASYSEEGDYEGSYSSDAQLGDVIYEKEIDTRSLPKSGAGRLLNISQFEDRLPEFKGVYHIMIRSTDDYWVRDSRFISLSDLGMIAKEGEDKIYVFTNSIKTADPVKGVNVFVYSANNQLIGNGATDDNGVAEVAYSKKDFSGFKPAMIIAKTADDFNYLPFNSTRVNTSRFEIGGKRNNASGLDAFIYAERDIYRPGEKVNYSVVLRDRQWKSPGDIPIKMKFLLPNGK
ncbi:MAG: MG2 domain-containing protein, partial [Bacteroidota bacterium]